jgi:hypothetical protein
MACVGDTGHFFAARAYRHARVMQEIELAAD